MQPVRAIAVEPFSKMMKTKPSLRFVSMFAGLLVLAAAAFSAGCVAVAAGAGAGAGVVAYVRGELEVTVDHPFAAVVRASDKAVQQLEFAKVNESKDALLAIITVRNAADKKIKIQLDSVAPNLTKIQIRVGFFGDEALSNAVLDKIRANL
jgi:hypothetical protein